MKIRFCTFYIANKTFWTTKKSVLKTHKIGIFAKGLVDGFGQIFEILWTFHFLKIQLERVFCDVRVRKQAFLEIIKMDLKRGQNWHFCKGDSPWFWSKSWSFFHLLCLSKIHREKVFADVLDKKEAFKDYKKNCVRKTQN